ncbi:Pet309p [Rhodotorula paludigena]|uniref:Pet309p n=1 Tax=Rhodotorula paludigena TaxID=86838 RepID=UPI00316D8006
MVVNLSYKFTHLAQSFRPHHHFNTLRNAFPSTHPAGFDFTSNVFGSVSNAASNAGSGATTTTLGVAAGALGAGAGAAAGAGSGGAAGGAGGASSKAGSWASHWGFQGKSLSQGQAAQADSQLDDADDLRSIAHARRRTFLRSTSSQLPARAAPLAARARQNSLSQRAPADLLRADEAGLSGIRLSGAELQKRYHSAFARGAPSAEEAAELEREADEIDVEVGTDVLRSGRRASISNRPTMTLASPFVITTTPLVAHKRRPSVPAAAQRGMHTSTSALASSSARPLPPSSNPSDPSFAAAPPAATVSRVRRNSTSALPSSSEPLVDLPPARSASPRRYTRELRPPSGSPLDANDASRQPRWPGSPPPHGRRRPFLEDTLTPEMEERRNAILAAEKTGKPALVERAVQQYLADPTKWSTLVHNTAISALHRTRRPNEPLDRIVQLYNQLFESDRLKPNRTSYELVLKAFLVRDGEVRELVRFIEKRQRKKLLANAARGPWDVRIAPATEADSTSAVLSIEGLENNATLERERQRLEALQGADYDYFQPALQIYEALGSLADKLHSQIPTMLIQAAAARGQVDTALSLFERMERSRHQKPGQLAYQALITVYGQHEKDSAAILEVLEAYLAARQSGELVYAKDSANKDVAARRLSSGRPSYRQIPVKQKYDTEPRYEEAAEGFNGFAGRDEWVWGYAMKSLFDAGDAAGAVALLERLLVAQNSPDPLPLGYPATLTSPTLARIVIGFIDAADEVSAKKWFDRYANPQEPSTSDVPPHGSYILPLYVAIQKNLGDLANHIFRTYLARVNADFRLAISEFVAVVDLNLARAWSAQTQDERTLALDAVAEFRAAFERAARSGHVVGDLGADFALSTGLLSRITQALGCSGRTADAAATFVEFANIVRAHMRRLPEDSAVAKQQGIRSRTDWVLRAVDAASGALGFRPSKTIPGQIEVSAGVARPSLKDAVKVVGWNNKLRNVVGWAPIPRLELAVAEAYLTAREGVNADATALELSGDEWFTVVEAFAHSAALINRGMKPDFAFPGFEVAFSDFAASGAEIPIGGAYNYDALAAALKTAGFNPEQIRGVVEILARQAVAPVEPEPEPAPVAVEEDAASLTSDSLGPATSATAPSVAEESASEPAQYPTPPSTPPAYLAELPAEAAPAPPTAEFDKLSRALSDKLDALVFAGKTNEALQTALHAAQEGRLAHSEAYGRLIEQLGRNHRIAETRQVYLLAYQALGAMEGQPEAQSVAWTMLEDRMMVALAQAGELADVGHHRDRLLQAGCAPSADAYAAMILNMRDTTDDAAVALTLFEESQRLNVRPNVYLFNTLISKLSRARRAKEALEYFELMKQYGLRPSSITYGAIINACCKTGDDVSAAYLFTEMVSDPEFKPRVPPYNTMIQFYTSTKPDRERALHYYNELVRARVAPTGHTFKLLLDAYGTIGEPDLDRMQQVFAQLVRTRGVSVSGAHWASLITAYGIHAKQLDRALAIFDSIATHPTSKHNPNGPQPDAVVYEALINALVANQRAELCDKYLEQMRARSVRMTAYVANSLIKGYASQGLYDRARAVFFSLADPASGVASLGNHPIDRHPKHHHQGAQQPASSDEPTFREPSTYEAMIRCELAAGEGVRAAEVLRMAEARAFPPAVIGRLQKLLAAEGIEALPLQQQ